MAQSDHFRNVVAARKRSSNLADIGGAAQTVEQ